MRCIRLSFLFAILLFISISPAQFPETVHPGYTLVNLRPAGFEPKGIGGMDFLADGTIAICTWGGYQKSAGELFLISGVDGASSATVQVRKIAQGLIEPMGLKVVNGEIYVMQRTELSKLIVPSGTALAIPSLVVGGWAPPVGDWTYGLVYKDGSFYGTQGGWGAQGPGALTKDQNSWTKLTPGQGYKTLAGGLRNADGIGLGPEGEMFATDNQGNWLPSSKLIHLVPGRFYGHQYNAANPFAKVPESPPAVWVPHGKIGASPSEPILVAAGIYQGQMLAGDVHFGGMARYFLEKVKGASGIAEYQGAVFRFTGGLECGMHRLLIDKTGTIYMGGVGGNQTLGEMGGWNWKNTWTGLQKLVPNGKTPFDLLAVRSQTDGLELEFTQPVVDGGNLTKYMAEHWRYAPTSAYGGGEVDKATLTVQAATVSSDAKKVRLKLSGLKTGYVVHLKVTGLKSASAENLWASEAWYTLNNLGPAVTTRLDSGPRAAKSSVSEKIQIAYAGNGKIRFAISSDGPFTLNIRDASGKLQGNIKGSSSGFYYWTCPTGHLRLYTYQLIRLGLRTQSGHLPVLGAVPK